jgi:hypothetical protein
MASYACNPAVKNACISTRSVGQRKGSDVSYCVPRPISSEWSVVDIDWMASDPPGYNIDNFLDKD